MTTPKLIAIGMLITGAIFFAGGVSTYLRTGPGSGYKGYTTGHRMMMAFMILGGLVTMALSVWALLRLT